jgi:hypothetical protein
VCGVYCRAGGGGEAATVPVLQDSYQRSAAESVAGNQHVRVLIG